MLCVWAVLPNKAVITVQRFNINYNEGIGKGIKKIGDGQIKSLKSFGLTF